MAFPGRKPPSASGNPFRKTYAPLTESGTLLGTVTRVFPTGSNHVCEVTGETREYLIPLIADVIVRLNVTPPERVLIIRPIPGLLDDN